MQPTDWLSTSLGDRWTLVLLHFLWQGLLISLAAAGLLHLLRPRKPAVRYGLLLAALGLQVVAPLATFAVLAPQSRVATTDAAPPDMPSVTVADVVAMPPPETSAVGDFDVAAAFARGEPPVESFDSAESLLPVPIEAAIDAPSDGIDAPAQEPSPSGWYARVQPVILLAWLVGSLGLGLRLAIGFVRTLLLRRGRVLPGAELLDRTAAIAAALGFRRPPRLFLSERVRDAVAIGYLRPLLADGPEPLLLRSREVVFGPLPICWRHDRNQATHST